jgi:hypothetical protein
MCVRSLLARKVDVNAPQIDGTRRHFTGPCSPTIMETADLLLSCRGKGGRLRTAKV